VTVDDQLSQELAQHRCRRDARDATTSRDVQARHAGDIAQEEVAVRRHRGQAAPLRDDECLGKNGHVRLEGHGKVTQNSQVSRDVLDLEGGG
jgi:hypothetical protein